MDQKREWYMNERREKEKENEENKRGRMKTTERKRDRRKMQRGIGFKIEEL